MILLEPLDHPETELIKKRIVLVIWAVVALASPIWFYTTQVYRAPLPFDTITYWNGPDVN